MTDGRLRNYWIVRGRLDSAATASDVNEIGTTNSSIQWTNHRLRNGFRLEQTDHGRMDMIRGDGQCRVLLEVGPDVAGERGVHGNSKPKIKQQSTARHQNKLKN
eukprot:scaffold74821_cov98-Cyclotella_meneghiniana.AAC.2